MEALWGKPVIVLSLQKGMGWGGIVGGFVLVCLFFWRRGSAKGAAAPPHPTQIGKSLSKPKITSPDKSSSHAEVYAIFA